LGKDFLSWCTQVLSPERTAVHGFWNDSEISFTLKGMTRFPNQYFRIAWTLIMFQLWFEDQMK
jgi:hypothetical protein